MGEWFYAFRQPPMVTCVRRVYAGVKRVCACICTGVYFFSRGQEKLVYTMNKYERDLCDQNRDPTITERRKGEWTQGDAEKVRTS